MKALVSSVSRAEDAAFSTILVMCWVFLDFPDGSVGKNPPVMQETQETWVQALGQEDPLEILENIFIYFVTSLPWLNCRGD